MALVFAFLVIATGCTRTEDAWLTDLESEDAQVRTWAAVALGQSDPSRAEAVVPSLLGMLSDPDPKVARHALRSIEVLGAPSLEVLLDTLSDDAAPLQIRRHAANACALFGAAGIEALVTRLGAAADGVALLAAESLAARSTDARAALPVLLAWLRGEQGDSRREAAPRLLARLQPWDLETSLTVLAAEAGGDLDRTPELREVAARNVLRHHLDGAPATDGGPLDRVIDTLDAGALPDLADALDAGGDASRRARARAVLQRVPAESVHAWILELDLRDDAQRARVRDVVLALDADETSRLVDRLATSEEEVPGLAPLVRKLRAERDAVIRQIEEDRGAPR